MSGDKILFVGAGAIGAAVAAWVAGRHDEVYVTDVGDVLAALKTTGITTYRLDAPAATRRTVHVRTVEGAADLPDADIVVLAVKNFSLEAVAREVHARLGDRPVIVSLANGVDNQSILPRRFSKVIYGVVGFNARRDRPVEVGYQRQGPLLIGALNEVSRAQLSRVRDLLALGCETQVVDRLQDVVHTKIVINLTNALDALVGHGVAPLSNFALYQRLLLHTLHEGAQTVRAAGFHEHRIPGIPGFRAIAWALRLPGWVTRPVFKRKLGAMVMSSMTQDVSLRGAQHTELESLTGYIVQLAQRVGVPVPYNRTLLRLGREWFHPGFKPLSCEAVWEQVQETIRRGKTGHRSSAA